MMNAHLTQTKNRLITLSALLFALSCQPCAAVATELSIDNTPRPNALEVSFMAGKQPYESAENISFRFQSNQAVYVYLYTSYADGSHSLILPNKLQTDNLYEANREYLIPDQRVRFQADGSSSTETVTLVATTQPIELSDAARRPAGDFYAVENEELHAAFERKGISIRDTDSAATAEPTAQEQSSETALTDLAQSVVKQLQISISDARSE